MAVFFKTSFGHSSGRIPICILAASEVFLGDRMTSCRQADIIAHRFCRTIAKKIPFSSIPQRYGHRSSEIFNDFGSFHSLIG